MVIVNTEKGNVALKKIKEKISYKQVAYELAINDNRSIVEATIYPPERRKFFDRIQKKGLEDTIVSYTSHALYARIQRKARRVISKIEGK